MLAPYDTVFFSLKKKKKDTCHFWFLLSVNHEAKLFFLYLINVIMYKIISECF